MPPAVAAFPARQQPEPCILLLSRTCDASLTRVQALLEGAGLRVARLDADALPGVPADARPAGASTTGATVQVHDDISPGAPSFQVEAAVAGNATVRGGAVVWYGTAGRLDASSGDDAGSQPDAGRGPASGYDAGLLVDLDGGRMRLGGRWLAPTVAWRRHFSGRAVDAGPVAAALFAQDSWKELAEQAAAIAPRALGPRWPGTLEQLAVARRLGIAVPRTIVTTDLSAARAAFRCPRVVVKAVGQHFVEAAPGRLTGVFPQVIERHALPSGPRPGPPVIVQEYVEHRAELRVYYVAGQVLGFEVGKRSPAEPWTSPAAVTVRAVPVPPAAGDAARALAAALALDFAALDFLIRAGEPVFLEANPDGDWDWAERAAGTDAVTRAVAAMLATLHRAALPAPAAAPFNLVAFLATPAAAPKAAAPKAVGPEPAVREAIAAARPRRRDRAYRPAIAGISPAYRPMV
jgi:hypothetical protein